MIRTLKLLLVGIFALASGEEKVENEVTPTVTYQTGNSHVFAFDGLIPSDVGKVMSQFLKRGDYSFTYLYPDPYENMPEIPNSGNLHMRSYVSPVSLIKMRLWSGIQKAYKSLPETIVKGRRFFPYEVVGTLLRRGDYTVPFQGDDDTTDKIFMRIFLTEKMGKHAYSDQSFYDENDEIFASVYPKVYRIVAWTGDVKTLFRPPSMGYFYEETSLLVKLSVDKELFRQGELSHKERMKSMKASHTLPFPYKNEVEKFDYEKVNISEKLLGKYHDNNGDVVAFFDDIFPKELVDAVRSYYTHYESKLVQNSYDPASSETHDNVFNVMQNEPEDILNTPYMKMVNRLGTFLSNSNKTDWHPYDVSCNLIQHAHHTRIHTDCNFNEYEFTFLMYMNPNWMENLYAETSFYQYDKETLALIREKGFEEVDGDGLEQFDFLAAVVPKYGRIAIFRNLIPHSARPPAPNFLAARYTFPIKVGESMRQARAKMLMERLDYKQPGTPEDPLYESLRQGKYEAYLKDDKRDWVEKHLELMRADKRKFILEGKNKLYKYLMPKQFLKKRDEL